MPKLDLGVISGRDVAAAQNFLGTFLAVFLLYALAYWASRFTRATSAALLVLLWSLILCGPLLLTYPIGANDIFTYVNHGEQLANFGVNPLVVPAQDVTGLMSSTYSGFVDTVSNYGPVWTWIEAAVVRASDMRVPDSAFDLPSASRGAEHGFSILEPVLGFKFIAVAAYLMMALLIYRYLRQHAPERAVAGLLFFAWNPLILFEYAVNGHNDALMITLVLAAALLWQRRHILWMVLVLTLALLVKIPPVFLFPLLFLSGIRRAATQSDQKIFLFATGSMLAVILIGIAYLSLPDGAQALRNLDNRADLFTHSLPAIVRLLLRPFTGIETASDIARSGALLSLGLFLGLRMRDVWKKPNHAIESAYAAWLFLLLFATLWFQPWYVTWLVPLAALVPRTSARIQAGLFSMTVTGSYIIGGFVWAWRPEFARWQSGLGLMSLMVLTSYGLPWIYYFINRKTGMTGHRSAPLATPSGFE
jgi:alpha-1,6-mannosyltransferase